MKLIVGLGNPGSKYELTRHNVGHMAVASFAKSQGLIFKNKRLLRTQLAKVDRHDTYLAFPTTYMNHSGQAVGSLVKRFRLKPADILVVYDEADLPLGTIRTRLGGTSAGHNGVQSIINRLGPHFYRLRIGVSNQQRRLIPADRFVLTDFSPAEIGQLNPVLIYTAQTIRQFIEQGALAQHTEIIGKIK